MPRKAAPAGGVGDARAMQPRETYAMGAGSIVIRSPLHCYVRYTLFIVSWAVNRIPLVDNLVCSTKVCSTVVVWATVRWVECQSYMTAETGDTALLTLLSPCYQCNAAWRQAIFFTALCRGTALLRPSCWRTLLVPGASMSTNNMRRAADLVNRLRRSRV